MTLTALLLCSIDLIVPGSQIQLADKCLEKEPRVLQLVGSPHVAQLGDTFDT